MDKTKAKKLARILVLVDSVILSIPLYIDLFFLRIDNIMKLVIVMIVSSFVFTILILVSYKTIGKILKKKGW